ncbi:MAG: M35 family metallo-endopeptidase [Thermoanaerobaculia bacterium]
MTKDRVRDAASYVQRAVAQGEGGNEGNRAKKAVLDFLKAHPEITGLDHLLSLGGYRGPKAFHDEDKTEMRQYQRALLLIERTLGGKTDDQVAVIKAHFVSTTGTKAQTETNRVVIEIRSVYSRWRDKHARDLKPRTVGEPILAPSFEYATSLAKNNIGPAFARASQLLTHAWMGIMRVGLDANEKKRLEKWFGTYEKGRYDKVRATLKSVFDVVCAKSVTVYYRGTGAPSTALENDTPDFLRNEGALGLGPTTAYGYVYPGVTKTGEWHVFLGKAFFADASRHGRDSLSGVIIHEMTHLTKKTQDHVYGAGPCETLAKEVGGPAKAVENADSYEYYCESFQSSVTTKFG